MARKDALTLKRFDSVVADDTFKGNRPFLIAATSIQSSLPSVTLSFFTTRKRDRSGKYRAAHPGWLPVAAGEAGLEADSYLRPTNILNIEESKISRQIGTLPAHHHARYLSIIESCLRPFEPTALSIPSGFLRSLPPPHLRAGASNGSLTDIYAILEASGWKPPRHPSRREFAECRAGDPSFRRVGAQRSGD